MRKEVNEGNYVFGIGSLILLITSFVMLFTDGVGQFVVGILASIPLLILFVLNYKFRWFIKYKEE